MKKKNLSTILLMIVFLAGLSLLLYPTVSNYWNSFHQSYSITNYSAEVANLSREEYKRILENARDYNKRLAEKNTAAELSDEQSAEYLSQLKVSDTDIMGYVDIPSINCKLAIYHGTADSVLQVGAGHLPWSALPVGGEGTHCVLSGHRGLPSARLFTDLDQLVVGDYFQLNVLGETLTYEVDQILIVLPEDTKDLQPVKGKDYCTLVTCTPYGVNTHRMLVRGKRIENPAARGASVVSNAVRIEPIVIAPLIAVPILLLLLLLLLVKDIGKSKEESKS